MRGPRASIDRRWSPSSGHISGPPRSLRVARIRRVVHGVTRAGRRIYDARVEAVLARTSRSARLDRADRSTRRQDRGRRGRPGGPCPAIDRRRTQHPAAPPDGRRRRRACHPRGGSARSRKAGSRVSKWAMVVLEPGVRLLRSGRGPVRRARCPSTSGSPTREQNGSRARPSGAPRRKGRSSIRSPDRTSSASSRTRRRRARAASSACACRVSGSRRS